MTFYLTPFLALAIVVAIWIFLWVDDCWEFERDKKWFNAANYVILPLGIALCLFWAQDVWTNTERLARQYLQTAANYAASRNKPKQLEYALKAYETDPTLPDVLSYLGYSYLTQNNDASFRKGLEILVGNSNRLDETGKATLGTTYYYLKDYRKSYQILGEVNFDRIGVHIFPWAVTALTKGAFETLPYDDALLKMKNAIVSTERRMAQAEVKIAASAHQAIATWMPERWLWFSATKFHAGRIWLENAHKQGIQGQMIPAIRMITEGMSVPFSHIDKKDIVNHLRSLNNVLIEETGFFARNETVLLQDLDQSANKLGGGKDPPYDVEVTKLELLQNCLIDLHNVQKPKKRVHVNKDITSNHAPTGRNNNNA